MAMVLILFLGDATTNMVERKCFLARKTEESSSGFFLLSPSPSVDQTKYNKEGDP